MSEVAESRTTRSTKVELRALDPDLPMLAARAAMQLDTFISASRNGEKTQEIRTDAINKLAAMVTSVTLPRAAESPARALMDPLTANIVSRAYSEASNAPLRSWKDLELAANKLSEMFKSVSHPGERGQDPLVSLQLLRDFCVKLSEYAASKRQLAYGERPVPTHWRLR